MTDDSEGVIWFYSIDGSMGVCAAKLYNRVIDRVERLYSVGGCSLLRCTERNEIMEVTYIHHSGFLVELSDCILLFDYDKGSLPRLSPEKPLIVFASHRHSDHYNQRIFEIEKEGQGIRYILAWDIDKLSSWPQGIPAITFLEANQEHYLEDLNLKIETLKSTDEGVAYLLTHPEGTIYHGGDLHWWHWEGAEDDFNKKMARDYQAEIDRIAGQEIDIAFVPVDPLLNEQFYWGIDYFMKRTNTKQAYPMHFWDEPQIIQTLKDMEISRQYKDRIVGPGFYLS